MACCRESFESSDSSVFSEEDQEEVTVLELISAISDEEVSQLLQDREKLKVFCRRLLKCLRPLEIEEDAIYLRRSIERVATRSDHLQCLIETFLYQRRQLLKSLKEYVDKMGVMTKLCNTGKIISSVMDSAAVIGRWTIKQNNSFYINIAFEIANAAGFIGFACSTAELIKWKTILDDLMREIQKDQDLFAPIQEWFQQNNELERAVQAMLPLNLTSYIVKEFENLIKKEMSRQELLQMILEAVLKEDRQCIRNLALIQNLIDFTACPAASHWCRWIFLRHHKVTLDVAKMLLQLNSPQRLLSNQNVGTVTRSGYNSTTVAVLGRVGLNCINVYGAICTLINGGMVEELRKLERHLQKEMEALIQIERLIRRRRSS